MGGETPIWPWLANKNNIGMSRKYSLFAFLSRLSSRNGGTRQMEKRLDQRTIAKMTSFLRVYRQLKLVVSCEE